MNETKQPALVRRNRAFWAWLALTLVYYLLATFMHYPALLGYSEIFAIYGRTAMEAGVHYISIGLLVVTGGALLIIARKRRTLTVRNLVLLGATLGLIGAAEWLLVCTNAERIHYPQYAILALLLSRFTRREYVILGLCTLAGMFDELMQYVLFPWHLKQLEFNDFLLNVLGAGLGIALLRLWSPLEPSFAPLGRRFERGTYFFGALALAIGAILWAAGIIVSRVAGVAKPTSCWHSVEGSLRFVLSYHPAPDRFWSVTDYHRSFHTLSPEHGSWALVLLVGLIGLLLRTTKKAHVDDIDQ